MARQRLGTPRRHPEEDEELVLTNPPTGGARNVIISSVFTFVRTNYIRIVVKLDSHIAIYNYFRISRNYNL